MLCSYGNQGETSLSGRGHTCTNLPLEAEEKKELKNLLKFGKFSFYVTVDGEVFTYLEAVVQTCSCSKGVLRNFIKFTGKHLYQSLFLLKLQG